MVIAVCSLAVLADRERGELRAAYGSAGPVPALVTAPLDARADFPELVAAAASPIDDVRGTAAYRRHALQVLTKRAPPGSSREDPADRQRGAARGGRLGRRACSPPRATRSSFRGRRTRASRASAAPAPFSWTATLCACLGRAGGRASGDDRRGAADGRRAPPRPAGVRRRRRRPVRLLHPGPRRRDGCAARTRAEPVRRRDPRGAVGQSLPLHRLREDLRRRPARGRPLHDDDPAAAGRTSARAGRRGGNAARRDAEGDR